MGLRVESVVWKLALFLVLLQHCVLGDVQARRQEIAEVGSNVTIDCHVTLESYVAKGILRVVWKWKPKNETEWKLLATTERGTNNKGGMVVSTLHLSKVSLQASGDYACFVQGNASNAPLDQVSLLVGYPPDPPSHLNCQTNGDLDTMLCYWNPGRITNLPIVYRFDVAVDYFKYFKNETLTATSDPISIIVTSSYSLLHYLSVNVSNDLGSAKSQTLELFPCFHVKTEPPQEIKIENCCNTSRSSSLAIRISWTEPDVNIALDLSYRLRYRKTNFDTFWTIEDLPSNQLSFDLINLDSFTSYDIQLAARPDPYDILFNGSWSDWSENITHRTSLQAPSEHFFFHKVSATSSPAKDVESDWMVNATWQIYSSSYQPGFYYDITFHVSGKSEQRRFQQNQATFFVRNGSEVVISGRFCNDLGCSSASMETVNLNEAPPPVEDVSLTLNSNLAVVTWKPNPAQLSFRPSSSMLDELCVIRICSLSRQQSRAHLDETVAAGRPTDEDSCQADQADVVVPCSKYRVEIPSSVSQCREYFAVVFRVFQIGIQDLMTSSKPSATAAMNASTVSASSFVASDISSSSAFAINTRWRWKTPQCGGSSHEGLRLSVIYTPLSGSECGAGKKCPLKDPHYVLLSNCSSSTLDVTEEVYGSTTYSISLGQCCQSETDSMDRTFCFPDQSLSDNVITSVGAPGIPRRIKWTPSNPLKLSWLPPEHRNGDLDGYLLRYARTVNGSENNEAGEDFKEIFTKTSETELPIQCVVGDEGDIFWLQLAAYNLKDGKSLMGPYLKQQGQLCASVNPDSIYDPNSNGNLTAIAVGLITAIVVFFLALSVCFYHRRLLKHSLRKHVWPSIPSPCIFVPVGQGEDEGGKQCEDAFKDDDESYFNSAYSSNSHNINEDVRSCREIPDSICEFIDPSANNNSNNNNNKKSKDGDGSRVKGEGKPTLADFVDDVTNASRETHFSKPLTLPSPGCTQICSDVTSLCPSPTNCSNDLFPGSSGGTQSTATWRTTLYPSATDVGELKRQRRPHSYAGSSGNSFIDASYVKSCSGVKQTDDFESCVSFAEPSLTSLKYKKLGPNPCNPLLKVNSYSCACVVTADAYPPHGDDDIALLPTLGKNFDKIPAFHRHPRAMLNNLSTKLSAVKDVVSAHAQTSGSDVDSTSPYVTLPGSANERYPVQGATVDSSSSDGYCDFSILNGNNTCSSDSGGDAGKDWNGHLDCAEPRRERALSNGYVSDCSPSALSEFPLLECYSPPATDNAYVSLNEALGNSEHTRSDPSFENEESKITGEEKQDKRLKFNFDEEAPYVTSSSSDVISYVSGSTLLPNFKNKLDPGANLQTDVAPYVIDVDANFFD